MNFEKFANVGYVVWILVTVLYLWFCIFEHAGTKYYPYPDAAQWAKPGIFILKGVGCTLLAVSAASMVSAAWVVIGGILK